MEPTSTNTPLDVAMYAVGLVLAIPTVIAVVRLIFFVARADAKLEQLAAAIEKVGDFKHEVRNDLQQHETRLTLVERDVEQLKDSAA